MPFPALYHYSANRLRRKDLRDMSQIPSFEVQHSSECWKPRGLWVTPKHGQSWVKWCQSERFRSDSLQFESKIVLMPDANILWLSNEAALRRFHLRWSFGERTYGDRVMRGIRWDSLARAYDGVLISPYIWACRLGELFWYYPWDCASGAIWNARSAVLRVESRPFNPGFEWTTAQSDAKMKELLTEWRSGKYKSIEERINEAQS